jgi:type IV pilus assembly protein PilN
MIRINLLPLKEAERSAGRRNQVSLIALGGTIALLIMVVPYMNQSRQLSAIATERAQINQEIQRYNEQVKEVAQLDQLRRDVQSKLQVVRDLNDKRVGPAHVLRDLSLATPDNLWLLDFNEGNGNATFTGMALDNETIARFMRQLAASPYFVGVDLVETSRRDSNAAAAGGPESFTRFIVKATIDYFGRDGKPAPGSEESGEQGKPAAAPGSQAAVAGKEPKA